MLAQVPIKTQTLKTFLTTYCIASASCTLLVSQSSLLISGMFIQPCLPLLGWKRPRPSFVPLHQRGLNAICWRSCDDPFFIQTLPHSRFVRMVFLAKINKIHCFQPRSLQECRRRRWLISRFQVWSNVNQDDGNLQLKVRIKRISLKLQSYTSNSVKCFGPFLNKQTFLFLF